MTNALIVYGTRYGATASTSEDIAKILRDEGFDVSVVNAKKDKVRDITEYELVIVGSVIQINRWTKEPEKFLKKFQKELAKKKVALFVCCGSAQPLKEEEKEALETLRHEFLDYLVSQTIEPYKNITNHLIALINRNAYEKKERLVESLCQLIKE